MVGKGKPTVQFQYFFTLVFRREMRRKTRDKINHFVLNLLLHYFVEHNSYLILKKIYALTFKTIYCWSYILSAFL